MNYHFFSLTSILIIELGSSDPCIKPIADEENQ